MRTWNLVHGNAKPPERRDFLEEMVRLVSADHPGVVLLQEVPAWALAYLDDWSGMVAAGDVAARPSIGPFPSTAGIGHALTSIHHGALRSAFSGQANAVLVAPELLVLDHEHLVLNPRGFRRREARAFGLGLVARLAWAGERRVCQALRIGLTDSRTLLVGNLHATSYPPDERLAAAELLRAATWLDGLAREEEPTILGGDLNQRVETSQVLRDLTGSEWGYSQPGAGIDHVLVRNAEPAGPPQRWPEERRLVDGHLLSDHAPVDVVLP
ncbi:MAG: hypothetical protein QOE36_743 [Gaiellaceae bacterium]|nr:hypothetical protein [Gaiellaceae bacterium]